MIMETKSKKAKSIAYEAALVSLIINDICLDKVNDRVITVLQLLAKTPECGIWKGMTLQKWRSNPGLYMAKFDEGVLALLEDFMSFTGNFEPEDLTEEFIMDLVQMLVAVGSLSQYIRAKDLETRFIQAALQWLQICREAQGMIPNYLLIRVIGALQAYGLAPMVVFRERENTEEAIYKMMVNRAKNSGGLPN